MSSLPIFNYVSNDAHICMYNILLFIWIINPLFILLNKMTSIMLSALVGKIGYYTYAHFIPSWHSWLSDYLSLIGVDSDVLTKLSPSKNYEYLVLASLATIMVEPLFLFQILRLSLML